MSFQQGLSGLAASSKNLDVVGNNIANASTYGFKQAKAIFSDIYAASLDGGGSGQAVGLGVKVSAVTQEFTQGNITSTGSSLDMAINGGGFFRLNTNGVISYSRNGQFQLDKEGFIVNSNGDKLTGFQADGAGNITAGSPVSLKMNLSDINPQTTTSAVTKINLDSRSTIPTTTPFNSTDPTSFNYTTSMTVYDSLGNAKTLTSYFVKTAANTWNVQGSIDGTSLGSLGTLSFATDGSLNTATSTVPITVNAPASGGAAALSFSLDYTGSTQFGSLNSVNTLTQDGFASGKLSGYSIGRDGTIVGRYSNGQTKNMGQVSLVSFVSPTALQALGDNKFAETPDSGQPLVGTPGTSSLGVIQSSSLEESTVDLTSELVKMITVQRNYQANAQTIKTQDQVLQTLVNLR